MKRKAVFMVALLLVGQVCRSQSSSSIERMADPIKEGNLVTCTDKGANYFVSAYQTTRGYFGLIVRCGTETRYYSSEPDAIPKLESGYAIHDVKIEGKMCYFCGEKWSETGNYVYTIDGTSYQEIARQGLVGRFSLPEFMSGGGNYELMMIDGTSVLTEMDVYNGGLNAIGTADDGTTSCILEMRELSNTGATHYKYKVTRSSYDDEVFTGIAHAYDKTAVASRYMDPTHGTYYDHNIGLRYGSATNFASTNTGVYNYNEQNTFGGNMVLLGDKNPVRIASVNVGEAVVLGHLVSSDSHLKGRVVMYWINSKGAPISQVQYTRDAYSYKDLKSIRFNLPLGVRTRMAMLLEDTSGNSVLRFPTWGRSDIYKDSILYTGDYKLQSIAPYQFENGTFELSVMGREAHANMKIVDVRYYTIHDDLGWWYKFSCLSKQTGSIGAFYKNISPTLDNTMLSLITAVSNSVFTKTQYTTTSNTPTTLCSDGN